jgi:hypothetical protein
MNAIRKVLLGLVCSESYTLDLIDIAEFAGHHSQKKSRYHKEEVKIINEGTSMLTVTRTLLVMYVIRHQSQASEIKATTCNFPGFW